MNTKVKKSVYILFLVILLSILTIGIMFCLHSRDENVLAETESGEVVTQQETQAEQDKSSWTIWFEEKVMPYIISISTAVGLLLSVICPIIAKVKKLCEKLSKAHTDVENSTRENKRLKEQILEMQAKLSTIEKTTNNNEQILRIGFCNLSELVTNGYANEISKVGQVDDKEV